MNYLSALISHSCSIYQQKLDLGQPYWFNHKEALQLETSSYTLAWQRLEMEAYGHRD